LRRKIRCVRKFVFHQMLLFLPVYPGNLTGNYHPLNLL